MCSLSFFKASNIPKLIEYILVVYNSTCLTIEIMLTKVLVIKIFQVQVASKLPAILLNLNQILKKKRLENCYTF